MCCVCAVYVLCMCCVCAAYMSRICCVHAVNVLRICCVYAAYVLRMGLCLLFQAVMDKWKSWDIKNIKLVEEVCSEYMERLGYELFEVP